MRTRQHNVRHCARPKCTAQTQKGKAGALRETLEETQAKAEIIKPYTIISLPHISQIHVFYLAKLLSDSFGPTNESSEVKLVEISDIPWDELAFPTVSMTLKYFVEDLKKDHLNTGIMFEFCDSIPVCYNLFGAGI